MVSLKSGEHMTIREPKRCHQDTRAASVTSTGQVDRKEGNKDILTVARQTLNLKCQLFKF